MPLTRLIVDALGVATIVLVFLLVLLGSLSILYLIYFHHHIRREGYTQLGYFNKPWIIRITLVLFAIWWGFGEISRLSFLRGDERILHAFNPKWQDTVCKVYIVSNLGFAEPCLFLTIVFLLHASLQKRAFEAISVKWNGKTAGWILLCCFPLFVLQLIVVLTGPIINNRKSSAWKVPHYFTRTATASEINDDDDIALCTYPLLSIVLLGLYATLLTVYLLWLGSRMVSSVINKGLRRRVFFLIFSVSSLFPLRVLLLGLSVLSRPEHFLFEALVFSAFFVLLSCSGLCICMLVYFPVADSLALRGSRDLETGRRPSDDHNDAVSLIANQSHFEASSTTSLGRNSEDSAKRGSISFRTMLKDEASEAPTEVFEELSLFSHGAFQVASPPGSPPLPGQPMFPLYQISKS